MRKLMMVVALVVVLVPLAAVASLAATGQLIQCTNVLPCTGGSGDDKILERIGDGKDDVIVPRGGNDLVLANKYTADTDVVRAGGGSDRINVADGDKLDTANGGKGRDLCIVDARSEAGTSCATVDVQRP
jgi:gamma-glutamyl phosphate reductase